jgi:hypothetical protein
MRHRTRRVALPGSGILVLALALPAMAATPASKTLDEAAVIHTLTMPDGSDFGWAISELQDVDGDGVTDLIVSDDHHTTTNSGVVYVFSGSSGALLYQFSEGTGGRLGYAIADAGDVDGDGTHDIVAGRPGVSTVYVYSGATGATLLTISRPTYDRLGVAVAGAGDVNADGHADLLVGAQGTGVNGTNAGRAYVFSGADGSVLHAMDGSAAGDLFGTATDQVPDIDGDGVPEHVVGARDAGKWNDGGIWLFSGATGTLRWQFHAPKSDAELGSFFAAGLPDVTGDGVPDVYAGDYAATTNGNQSGRAYVFSGADGSVFLTLDGAGAKEGRGPGREAGDLNGDGVTDLVIGSYLSRDGARDGGRFDVFSGADGTILATVVGTIPGAQLGYDAVGLGDVDGDGVPDVAVSAALANTVYVVSGASLLP